ncbi:hypothetical protein PPL_01787 [Heterostelium album PN500]|uniref:Uncharacterized protein n=1 Tax=Heterostelium pallidum (strain ATCC 26659 / Pp 5 / PN500) TaxID=670386 RepID=D3B0H0_HETP5|nr:hypothetical protein PPL_01787 [Heterostelium album PN500]EFA84794.1 hypothetical protein PPL_01787 [Heterostelium album PN500]|eukprot:XP_020436905.1 hypothetical protein PPL_01787 [Heterostelium album PN500]
MMESNFEDEDILQSTKILQIGELTEILGSLMNSEVEEILVHLDCIVNSMGCVSQSLNSIVRIANRSLKQPEQLSFKSMISFTGQTNITISNLIRKLKQIQNSKNNNYNNNNNNNNNTNNNNNIIVDQRNNKYLSPSGDSYDDDESLIEQDNSPCSYHTPFTTIGTPSSQSPIVVTNQHTSNNNNNNININIQNNLNSNCNNFNNFNTNNNLKIIYENSSVSSSESPLTSPQKSTTHTTSVKLGLSESSLFLSESSASSVIDKNIAISPLSTSPLNNNSISFSQKDRDRERERDSEFTFLNQDKSEKHLKQQDNNHNHRQNNNNNNNNDDEYDEPCSSNTILIKNNNNNNNSHISKVTSTVTTATTTPTKVTSTASINITNHHHNNSSNHHINSSNNNNNNNISSTNNNNNNNSSNNNNSNNNNNVNQTIIHNEYCTPFSPSSPPMSPSPMAAMATSDHQIHKNILLRQQQNEDTVISASMEEKRDNFLSFERSQTAIALNKIRNNMNDDAIQRKNQKGYAMMSLILNDLNTSHQSLLNQSHPVQISTTIGNNNNSSNNLLLNNNNNNNNNSNSNSNLIDSNNNNNNNDNMSNNGSPLDTYLSHEEEDLSRMYNVYKTPAVPLPLQTASTAIPTTNTTTNELQQQQQQQMLQNNRYKGMNDGNLSKVITFTKADPSTTTFQFIKEKVPKPSHASNDSDLYYDDYEDYDMETESQSYDDTYSSADQLSATNSSTTFDSTTNLSSKANNNNTTNNNTTAAMINSNSNGNIAGTTTNGKHIVNNNSNNNNSNTTNTSTNTNSNNTDVKSPIKQPSAMSPRSGPQSPRLYPARPSSLHRRAQSVGVFSGYPWFGGRLIQIIVFLPTQPQSMVDLSIDDDSTVEKVIIDILELCQREKKKLDHNSNNNNNNNNNSNNTTHSNNNNNNNQQQQQQQQQQQHQECTNSKLDDSFSSNQSNGVDNQSNNNSNGNGSSSGGDVSFSFLSVTTNPKAYYLRVCHYDGTVDNDYGVLERSSEMKKIKAETYVLLQNTNWTKEQLSPPPIFRVHIVPSAPLSHNERRLSSPQNNTNGVKDSIAVPYNPTATLSSIKTLICKKEKFSEDLCVFMLMNNEVVNNESITLEELAMGDIKLIHNRVKSSIPKSVSFIADSGNAPRAITKLLGPMFFFTPDTAGEFKQYQVIKVNKFGISLERLMGIDQDRIIHSVLLDFNLV